MGLHGIGYEVKLPVGTAFCHHYPVLLHDLEMVTNGRIVQV